MDNPSRLPTTPPAQHQVKRGDKNVFIEQHDIEPCDDDGRLICRQSDPYPVRKLQERYRNKRTNDVLPKPDKLISYRHGSPVDINEHSDLESARTDQMQRIRASQPLSELQILSPTAESVPLRDDFPYLYLFLE
ncbi:MAG: hypothetical protein QOF90_2295 [Acetobacteraceae bacterium]|nr:hypothetical protein [Acetobacteraceae bacterium]